MDTDIETGVVTITQPSPKSSSKKRKFFKGIKLFGGTILAFWVIVLVIAIIGVIPLTQVIVGSVHKNACPINHLIPIYLIGAGAVGLTLVVISLIQVKCFFLQIPPVCDVRTVCMDWAASTFSIGQSILKKDLLSTEQNYENRIFQSLTV
jgi:hypothetical protein